MKGSVVITGGGTGGHLKVADAFIEEYARLDGWGHVFGSYDGSNDEVTINGESYIVFRVN